MFGRVVLAALVQVGSDSPDCDGAASDISISIQLQYDILLLITAYAEHSVRLAIARSTSSLISECSQLELSSWLPCLFNAFRFCFFLVESFRLLRRPVMKR